VLNSTGDGQLQSARMQTAAVIRQQMTKQTKRDEKNNKIKKNEYE
jgi:hypothetical protein